MIHDFEKLSPEEQHFMLRVPALITVLIAGADEHIEKKETEAAAKLVKLRDQMGDDELMAYYHEVHETFEAALTDMIKTMPRRAAERNKVIASELERVNAILPKLDPGFASSFYKSIRSFAKRVAESSGGILGFASVGMEERHWMELAMIEDPSVN